MKRAFRLSPRETELLGLLCQGVEANTELAARLGVTVPTVKTYLHDLYAKMGKSTKLAEVLMSVEDELKKIM